MSTSKKKLQEEFSDDAQIIRDSDWRQQRCRFQELQYNKHIVVLIYAIIGILFIPIGIIALSASDAITYQEFDAYSSEEDCSIDEFSADAEWGKICTVTYDIDYDFDAPIYFYYKIKSVYVNFRDYVISRNEKQYRGQSGQVDECSARERYDGLKLLPCGLVAYSFFNDKYKVTHIDGSDDSELDLCDDDDQCNKNEHYMGWTDASWYDEPNWSKKHIAWESDRDERFSYSSLRSTNTRMGELQEWQNITLPDTDDEDFIVWMRTSTASEFLKLHRIIKDKSFKKGDKLNVTIHNYFEVGSFNGEKSIVISTNGNLGGYNPALGIIFIVVGCVLLTTAVFFLFLFSRKQVFFEVPRAGGNESQTQWTDILTKNNNHNHNRNHNRDDNSSENTREKLTSNVN